MQITWFGHSCFRIDTGKSRILIDPFLTGNPTFEDSGHTVRDVAKGEWRLEVDPRYGGTRVYPDGLEFTEEALETYTINEADPLSARARSEWSIRLHRPDPAWEATVRTRSETGCDGEDFLTSNEVICTADGEIVFHRTWEKRIPRTAG